MSVPVRITATGQAHGAPGVVASVLLTAGSDAATLVLHDGTAANNPQVTVKCPANDSRSHTFSRGLAFNAGIYAELTGTNPIATVEIA